MKDLVITVVDFFSWLGILVSTLAGYFVFHYSALNAYEYLGALAGFVLGCLGSGLWFVLSAIHRNLQALRDIAETGKAK